MKKIPNLHAFIRWLGSTEMFARPAKLLPGKWRLYEFYTEPDSGLTYRDEAQIREAGHYWKLNFNAEGKLIQEINLPVDIFPKTDSCIWYTSRNYVLLSPTGEPEANKEFQYAIEKSTLKLLKKDREGKIVFFGFFRKEGSEGL